MRARRRGEGKEEVKGSGRYSGGSHTRPEIALAHEAQLRTRNPQMHAAAAETAVRVFFPATRVGRKEWLPP